MPTGGSGGGKLVPLTIFQWGNNADGGHSAVANKVVYSGFVVSVPVTFSNIQVNIGVADGVNNNDIGIYNQAGNTLVANVGAQHFASTGIVSAATVQGAQTIQPGQYVLAFTSVGSTFNLNADFHWPSWAFNYTGVGTSVGGALPASIPAPVQGGMGQGIATSFWLF